MGRGVEAGAALSGHEDEVDWNETRCDIPFSSLTSYSHDGTPSTLLPSLLSRGVGPAVSKRA